MTKTERLDHAIAAHGMWKARLRKAIDTGKSEWTVDSVQRDDLCEFGKWLHSSAPGEQMTEPWNTVKNLHSEFHKEAARVLALALAGRQAEAEAAIELGSDFARTSADLTLTMVDWRDSLRGL
jgi:methyl-accepting chemotaxis protein